MFEYRDDPVYFKKMEKLCEGYKSLRRVRPDGNCFFRGFGYSYFEKLLGDEVEWKRFQTLMLGTKDQLLSQGFPKFTLEDFYDSVSIYNDYHNNMHLKTYLNLFSSLWKLSIGLEENLK